MAGTGSVVEDENGRILTLLVRMMAATAVDTVVCLGDCSAYEQAAGFLYRSDSH